MWKHIFLITVLIGAYFLWDQRPVKHGEGVMAPDAPSLERFAARSGFTVDNYTLNPRWKISGKSRILSRKGYWFDNKTEIAPYDFVLGWDSMSNEVILGQVKTPIRRRDYSFDVIRPPLTFNQMRERVLFMHAVPKNDEMRSLLRTLRTGHIITYTGYIVDITDGEHFTWNSSIGSDPRGLDKAQIIYLEELSIIE